LQGEYDEFDDVDENEEDDVDKGSSYIYADKSKDKRKKKKSPSRRRNSKGFSLNDHNSQRYLPVTLQQKLLVANPKYWRPEKPYIYTLVLSIRNSIDGSVLQSESCHFGLRTISKHDGLLCINNQPIMIRGVNYHEFNPVGGHTTDMDLLEADIKLMKRSNMNAIRTSHYPQVCLCIGVGVLVLIGRYIYIYIYMLLFVLYVLGTIYLYIYITISLSFSVVAGLVL